MVSRTLYSLFSVALVQAAIVYRDPSDGNTDTGSAGYNYKQVLASYTATSGQVAVTFSTRHDPGYFFYDDFSLTASGSSVNLIQNPGFETGSFAPWVLVGQQGLSAAAMVVGYSTHSGTKCVSDGAIGGIDGVSQLVDTVPGQTYDFSFWIRADKGAPALSQVVLSAFVPPTISAITTSAGPIPANGATNAASFTVSGTAPAGQGISLLANGTVIGQTTTVLGDTFSLTVDTAAFPYGNVAFTATTTAGVGTSNPSDPINVLFVPAGTYTLAGVVTGRTLTNVFIGGFTQANRPLTYTISETSGPLSSGTITSNAQGGFTLSFASANFGQVLFQGSDSFGNPLQGTVTYKGIGPKCNRDNCLRGLFGSNGEKTGANYAACLTALPTITITPGTGTAMQTITGSANLPSNANVCVGQGADKRAGRYASACSCLGVVPTTTTMAAVA